jgi:hypothetical protein
MDGQGIEKIIVAAREKYHEMEQSGIFFTNQKMEPVIFEPRPDILKVNSLTALVDYLKANIDSLDEKRVMLHVTGPDSVELISLADGKLMKRTTWLKADAPGNGFRFCQKYDPEAFNIALQSLFEDADDRAKVLLCAGTITSTSAETNRDDGVSQSVEAKRNVSMAQKADVPNPVTLRPWRTFREIMQPSSLFVLRVHEGPTLALYEADGSAWKLQAMQEIKAFLVEKLPSISIIA